MKSKTLIAVAVASTFGWSAASFAGSSHEVVTPFSPSESGENIFAYKQGFGSASPMTATGALSNHGSGAVSGSYTSSIDSGSSSLSGSGDEMASVADEDFLVAADDGSYSDYYIVSWTPAAADSWDYYLIDDGGSQQLVAVSDFDVWMPTTYELALVPSASDEMIYELVVVPTTLGDMTAFSSGTLDESAGE